MGADVCKDLTRLKFQKFGDTKEPRTGFEYLLIMQIASLTKERKEELERMAKEKAAELDRLKRTSIQQLWGADLDRLEVAINSLLAEVSEEEPGKAKKRKAAGGSGRSSARGRVQGGDENGQGEGENDGEDAAAVDM